MSGPSGELALVETLMARLFDAAEAARPALLEELTAAHPEHAAELRAGLAAMRDCSIFAAVPGHAEPGLPEIEDCELEAEIGAGGMGTVYRARQLRPVERQVAVKLIRSGLDSARVIQRFALEQQALARLSHPNVAQVLGSGLTRDRGLPYYLMEYIDGEPISRHCRRQGLSLRARLALFVQVCAGVQHAHHRGLIHRDLKPGNILVAEVEGQARAKVIDFGVARSLELAEEAREFSTEAGAVLGTPEYMAPEQATMNPDELDLRADVYALGVVLFELLCDSLPFGSDELRGLPVPEWIRIIAERPPRRPSAQAAASLPERDRNRLRGELDWIVLRCLEKDRERRYGSVGELVADLDRYQRLEPVLAGPPSRVYRVRRWLRRNRVLALGVAVLLVSAVLGGGTFMGEVARAQSQQHLAAQRLATMSGVCQDILNMLRPLTTGSLQPEAYREYLHHALDLVELVQEGEAAAGGGGLDAASRYALGVASYGVVQDLRTVMGGRRGPEQERRLARVAEAANRQIRAGEDLGLEVGTYPAAQYRFFSATQVAALRLATGRPDAAAAALEDALALLRRGDVFQPEELRAQARMVNLLQIRVARARGDAEGALQLIRKALEGARAEPQGLGRVIATSPLHIGAAGLLRKRGDHDAAREHFRQARDEVLAEKGAAQIIPLQRLVVSAQHGLALCALASGDAAAAEAAFVDLSRHGGRLQGLYSSSRFAAVHLAVAQIYLAGLRLHGGDPGPAVRCLEAASSGLRPHAEDPLLATDEVLAQALDHFAKTLETRRGAAEAAPLAELDAAFAELRALRSPG